MSEVRLLHYLHELTLGGGTVHVLQLLKDTLAQGVPCAVAAYQWGEMAPLFEAAGAPVYMMAGPQELAGVARRWQANVLHGHTCGGGSDALLVARELRLIGGETIHSMVPRTGPLPGDFEVVEVRRLLAMRPGATLIPWAFPVERFVQTRPWPELKQELGIPIAAPVIGRCGRLDGSKRPDEFVRVLAALPEVWGVMVGDGPVRAELAALATQLGCRERLILPGTQHDLGNWYRIMDVVVYPTADESVCAGVVEPLICRKPVVCTPVGAMDETILHGRTGLHARDTRELVTAVRWLLAHPKEAGLLAHNGRRHLERKGQLNPADEAYQHLELYRSLLK